MPCPTRPRPIPLLGGPPGRLGLRPLQPLGREPSNRLIRWWDSDLRRVVLRTLFFSLYCTIRHNQLPRGLACMACTGVSSRTSSTITMTYLFHYVLHYDLLRSTMTHSLSS